MKHITSAYLIAETFEENKYSNELSPQNMDVAFIYVHITVLWLWGCAGIFIIRVLQLPYDYFSNIQIFSNVPLPALFVYTHSLITVVVFRIHLCHCTVTCILNEDLQKKTAKFIDALNKLTNSYIALHHIYVCTSGLIVSMFSKLHSFTLILKWRFCSTIRRYLNESGKVSVYDDSKHTFVH